MVSNSKVTYYSVYMKICGNSEHHRRKKHCVLRGLEVKCRKIGLKLQLLLYFETFFCPTCKTCQLLKQLNNKEKC